MTTDPHDVTYLTVAATPTEIAGLRYWHAQAADFGEVEHATGADLIALLNRLAVAAVDSPPEPPDEPDVGDGPETIDMDAIVGLLAAEGIDAYVEQTGGGCATLFAGRLDDDDRDVMHEGWAATAGPGYFAGPGWTLGRGVLGDFWIGRNDDGDTQAVAPNSADPRESAELVAAVVRGELSSTWASPACSEHTPATPRSSRADMICGITREELVESLGFPPEWEPSGRPDPTSTERYATAVTPEQLAVIFNHSRSLPTGGPAGWETLAALPPPTTEPRPLHPRTLDRIRRGIRRFQRGEGR